MSAGPERGIALKGPKVAYVPTMCFLGFVVASRPNISKIARKLVKKSAMLQESWLQCFPRLSF